MFEVSLVDVFMWGVSPIIGALLMVVIVVIAFTGVYIWSIARFEIYRLHLKRLRYEVQEALEEYGIVEYAWIDRDGTLRVYVRNAGELKLCVLDVFVNDTLFMQDLNLCIPPGDGGWVNSSSTVGGRYVKVKLVTARFNYIRGEAYAIGG